MSESRSLSPWWLLLPAGLVVVCVAGVIADRTLANRALSRSNQTASATMETVEDGESVPGAKGKTAGKADSEPADEAEPKDKEPDAVVSQWSSLQDAVAESQRNGKPVMIDFSAEWCGPCKRMKRELFEDWKGGHAVQTAVIPVSVVDRAREDGRNPPEIEGLQQQFKVDAFPTLVVFSPATGRAMRTQGFGDAERTLAWITEAAKAVR